MKNTIINYKKLKNQYKTLVTNENSGLTVKEADYLVNFERNESNFNRLPKIVKSKEMCRTSESNYIEISSIEDISFRPRSIAAGPATKLFID